MHFFFILLNSSKKNPEQMYRRFLKFIKAHNVDNKKKWLSPNRICIGINYIFKYIRIKSNKFWIDLKNQTPNFWMALFAKIISSV